MLSVFLANAKSQHYGGTNIFSVSLHLMNCASETLTMGLPKKGLGFLIDRGPIVYLGVVRVVELCRRWWWW